MVEVTGGVDQKTIPGLVELVKKLNDDDKLTIGTGGDLVIKHVGDNSLVTNKTGDFIFEQQATDREIIFIQ